MVLLRILRIELRIPLHKSGVITISLYALIFCLLAMLLSLIVFHSACQPYFPLAYPIAGLPANFARTHENLFLCGADSSDHSRGDLLYFTIKRYP